MRISDWSSDVCSSDLPLKHRLDQVRIGNIDRHCNSSRAHPLDEMCSLFRGGGLNVSDDNGFSASGGGQHGARSSDPSARTSYQGDLSVEHPARSEEHTSELQSLMRISYAVFCLQK